MSIFAGEGQEQIWYGALERRGAADGTTPDFIVPYYCLNVDVEVLYWVDTDVAGIAAQYTMESSAYSISVGLDDLSTSCSRMLPMVTRIRSSWAIIALTLMSDPCSP